MSDIDYAGYVLAIRDAAVEAGMRVDGSWEFAASTTRLTNRLAELQAEVERLTRDRDAMRDEAAALTKAYASLAEGQDELVAEAAQLKRDLAAAEELAMNESMKHSQEHLRAERAEAELERIRPVYDAAFVAVDQSRNRSVQQRPTRFPDLYRAVDDARAQEAQDA